MGLLSRVGFIAAGVAYVTATTNVAAVESSSSAPLVSPDVSLARANAPQIFNAVNNAMRQWGSSVHHNGMSLFLVTVPAGNLFYHGCGTPDRRAGFEWLSFEPEHASYFGRSEEPRNDHEGNGSDGQQPSTPPPSSNAQLVMVPADPPADEPPQWPNCPELPASGQRGYIHTYKAARDLRVLYIDGQAAAKSFIGTLDIQNLVLLNFKDNPMDCMMGDMTRARSLCDLMTTEWAGAHIDGILRMEAGFELIYCDFADGGGLDLVSVVGSPFKNETGKADETGWSTESRNERDNLRASDPVPGGVLGMEWIRAVAQRYHGFEPERIEVDFSSMVSAFRYPLNRTNPDVRRPDLPRFVNASDDALLVMYGRVREVLHDRRAAKPSVHWQAVSDRVVSLFGSRLEAMAGEGSTAATMASQISSLVNPFINYGVRIDRNESVSRCATSHLTRTQELQHHWTKEDHLIFAAFEVITHRICNTLFDLRPVLDGPSDDDVLSARATARDLMQWLGWARFRGCAGQDCGDPERICFITMFPAGGTVDHFRPRCKTAEEIGQAESHGYFSTRPAPEEPLFSTMSTSATSYQCVN